MKNKIILFFSILLILASFAYADVIPYGYEPTNLHFLVKYDNQTITDNFRADILACSQESCRIDNSDECIQNQCSFYYYRIERVPPMLRLQISLDDKNFTSGIFNFSEKELMNDYYYDVNIDKNINMTITGIEGEIEQYYQELGIVPEKSDSQSNIVPLLILVFAFTLTIMVELIVLIIFLKKWKIKKWKKPIITSILANIISIPIVWISFLFLMITSVLFAVLITEAFAVIFEAYFIYWLNKNHFKLKQSFILSLVMNLASFLLGGAILAVISVIL